MFNLFVFLIKFDIHICKLIGSMRTRQVGRNLHPTGFETLGTDQSCAYGQSPEGAFDIPIHSNFLACSSSTSASRSKRSEMEPSSCARNLSRIKNLCLSRVMNSDEARGGFSGTGGGCTVTEGLGLAKGSHQEVVESRV
jgi:hypothetical protein